jgi:cation diffusion facilitator family transporter
VLAALAANIGIAIAKLVAFLITGSASLLAEFVHSLADCSDQVLLLVGRARADRAETEEHPFGYGRVRYLYGFLVSVVLFSVGGAYSIYDGIHKIIKPEPLTTAWIAFGVLGLSFILEASSLRVSVKEANKLRHGRGWFTFIRRVKEPDLIVTLLEDTAALLGLLFAFAGVGLAELTGNAAWDGGGSVAIGLLLTGVAVVVGRETQSLLIGEAASDEAEKTIVNALEAGPEVEKVIHLRTVHLSPDSLLVAAKIGIRPGDTGETIVRGIDAAESRVREVMPIAHVIYLEPDIYQESRIDHTDPSIRTVQRAWGDYDGPDYPRGTGPLPQPGQDGSAP